MKTDILSRQEIQERTSRTQAERIDQYTLWQMVGIWAVVTLPMALLAWVVAAPGWVSSFTLLKMYSVDS